MKQAQQLAERFREVILSGTWIANTNFKHQLSNITWEQAITKIGDLNTIAKIAFHIDYYVGGVLNVLEGGALEIRDKYSFDCPPITSQKDWEQLLQQMWDNAEKFAKEVEQLSDQQLEAVFVHEKYGNYHTNIDAMIEHSYYHLGQVVLIRKMMG